MAKPDQPRLLIIETSGRRGAVALAEGETLVVERLLDEPRRHARDLAPTVGALLRELSWQPRDLHGVIVSLGPGSYTGLRVGIMSAKAFAYATGCKLLGVETFHAIVVRADIDRLKLDVIADAQQEQIYVQSFARDELGARWRAIGALQIRPFCDWLRQRDSEAAVSGPGLERWESKFPAATATLDKPLRHPDARSLLTIGLYQWLSDKITELNDAEPLYLRASAAELQWQERIGQADEVRSLA